MKEKSYIQPSVIDKTMTYEKALAEITQIQSQLENNEIPIDLLIEKVKRANFLLAYCEEKLIDTENALKTITGQNGQ
jgi:exodeoxyribonuclease VII small subunit